MTPVIISNPHPTIQTLQEYWGPEHLILIDVTSELNAYQTAKRVNEYLQQQRLKRPVLILPIHLRNYDYPLRSDCGGLELAKEIRINANYQGQASRIQRLPIILLSHLNLRQLINIQAAHIFAAAPGNYLYHYREIPKIDSKKIAANPLPGVRSLAPFLRPQFILPTQRHGYANWWAAYRCCQHLELLMPQKFPLDYKEQLLENKNPQITLAQYYYDNEQQLFPPRQIKGWRQQVALNQRAQSTAKGGGIKSPKHLKKLVLIDDEADGNCNWAEIMSYLTYGNADTLSTISPEYDDDTILEKLSPDLAGILLDLYLGAEELGQPATQTRGVRLLGKIKRKFPLLPVIITTVSNKSLTRKVLRNLGADAIWIKEGIDEDLSRQESIERVLELSELCGKILSTRYQFLPQCALALTRITEEECWWETHRWTGCDPLAQPGSLKKKLQRSILEELNSLRFFLQIQLMEEGFQDSIKANAWLPGILIGLSNYIEHIHQNQLGKGGKSTQIRDRGDYFGFLMYLERSRAAHFKDEIKEEAVIRFIKCFLCYLIVPPDRLIRPRGRKSLKEFSEEDKVCQQFFHQYFPE